MERSLPASHLLFGMPVFPLESPTQEGYESRSLILCISPKRFLKSVMCWQRGMFDQLEPTGVKVAEELSAQTVRQMAN